MRYFNLSGVSMPISVICLGSAELGSRYPEDASFAVLDAFAERGGNFLDTAHVYADWIPGGVGASERMLGRFLQSRGVQDRFAVATKGGHPRLESMEISRLRPEDIARDIDESRERLQVDVIDLYYLHRDDPAVPISEILGALNEHVAAGRIRAIGASNWTTARLRIAADYARDHGLTGFCASQIAWSLALKNGATDDIGAGDMISMDEVGLRFYETAGLRVIPYSSQAGGFFAHPYDEEGRRYGGYHSPLNRRRWERVQEMAAQRGVSPNALALAYLLNHPCGGQAAVGAHSVAQVTDSCSAVDIVLDVGELGFLEGGFA